MALNTLPAGAFADDAISSDKINLANTFAFTGTVTGTPKALVKVGDIKSTSSSTNHDITSCFSDTYDTYFFDLKTTPENGSYQTCFQWLNGSTAISSGYYGGAIGFTDSNATINFRASSNDKGILGNDGSNARRGVWQGYFSGPKSTEANYKRCNFVGGYFTSANVFYQISGSMWNTSTTSCDGIRFLSNGTPIDYISCQIYGVLDTRS